MIGDRLGLRGKVAFITGAGRGIGEATAYKLAQEGVRVAVTDAQGELARNVASKLIQAGYEAVAFGYDVTNPLQAKRIVGEIYSALGCVDILVNNAGVSRHSPFLDLEEEEWRKVLDVNLGGTYRTTRAVLPNMVSRKSGRIINVASITGRIGFAGFSHYCASKFAQIGLTQSLAAEFAPFGITINSVCPGTVDTPMRDVLAQEMAGAIAGIETGDAAKKFMDGLVPLGRPQTAEDVAEVILFLASDLARNVTGAAYHVDGGAAPR